MPPARPQDSSGKGWSVERAEELLCSLNGVVSARVVGKPGAEVEEIHLLTTEEVGPKQTVRNVESALLAEFGLSVDHRRISVAQTREKGRGNGSTITQNDSSRSRSTVRSVHRTSKSSAVR